MYLVAQSGDLQKAAALVGNAAGAPFERVHDLLAAYLDQAEHVAEGIDAQNIVQCDVPLLDVCTNTAAVEKGDVRAGLVAVGVRAQVAQIGLRAADHTDRPAVGVHLGGIIDGQIHIRVSHDILKLLVQFVRGIRDRAGHLVFDAQQLRCGDVVVPGVKARGDLAVGRDAAPSDAGQLRAAGGTRNVLPVLVLHDHLIGVMAVTVQERVDPAGV